MPTPRKLAPLFRSKLLAGTALCGALALMPAARALALPAPINPTTAQSGGADLPPTITVTATTMTVAADAQNTFIQWRSYTVASGETVDYTLPSASSIVLNVLPVGTKADIEGDLNAYIGSVGGAFGGNVWFSAPSGIIFGAGAVINVGGLLATTASPNEKLFLTEGNIPPGLDAESSYAFFAPGINGVPFAQGPITVTAGAQINAAGSLVALISPTVVVQAGATITNSAGSGVFVHNPGGVLYGAADTYTVSLIQERQGDLDLLKFVIGTPADVSATPLTLLGTTNGANVYVASLSASTIANAVVNAGGLIEATKVQAGLSGEVILSTASDTLVPGQLPTATSLTISPADLELGDIAAAADLKALSSGNLTIGAGSLVGAAAGMTLQAQGDITLGGALSAPGNAVALTAGGDIDQTGGIITAGNLAASAATGISLADANDAGAVTLANTTSGDVDYVSGQTTSVASAADPAGAISLSTTAGDLDLAGNVNAGANPVTLGAAGDIAQTAGIITADTLSASAATGISLTDANAAGNVTLANTASGDVGYVGGQTTTVLSASDAGGNVALTTIAGDLDLIGAVSAGANAVTLSAAAGDIDQIGGIVTAGSLSASAGDGVSLADANAAAKVSLANSDFGVVDYVSAIALDVLSASNTGGAVSISTTSGDLDNAGTVSASGNLANINLAAAGDLGLGGAVSTPGNAVTLSAGGNIDQTAGIITAATLTATAATGLDLPDANAVATVGDLANSTSGDIDYASAGSVAVTAASDPAGNVSLTANAGSLTLSAATAGLDLSLSAVGGEVDVTPSAPVTVGKDYFATGETFSADALGIDPPGNVTIVGTGPGLDVSGAAIAAGDNVSITADNGLLTAGAVTAGAGNISLTSIAGGVDLGGTLDAGGQSVTLAAAAGIDQTAGVIVAGNLTATAATGVSLTDVNAAGTVALANSTSGAIDYVSGQSTTILSATGPAGAVSISTTVGDLDLAGAVDAGPNGVTLTAAGDIDQTAGVITAGSLGASAATGISLADANRAGTVTLANSTSGDVTYVSAIGLDVLSASNGGDALSISTTAGGLSTTGTVSAGADVTLASAANLGLGGDVIAPGTVTLTAAGDIDQTSGTVFAASLSATAATGISLADDNAASDLTLANSTSGDVTYVSGVGLDVLSARNGGGSVSISTTPGDTDDLSTTGTVSASGNVTLASAGNLALGADVSAPGNTVTLTAAGGIGQAAGIVTAGALAATAATGISLADANAAGTVALANSTSGAIDYVSGQSTTILSATGPAGAISISTTAGDLNPAGAVNAGTSAVTLTAAGDIDQTGGVITGGSLFATAATGISLADANAAGDLTIANSTSGAVTYVSRVGLDVLSASNGGGALSLGTTAGGLVTSGTVSASGDVTLASAADLGLGANVSAPGNTVTLTAAGDIDQTAGIVTAGALSASAATGISLTDANAAGTLTLANSTSGDATYVSAIGLDVLSASNGGGAASISTTAGDLSTTGTVSASGDVTLASAANLGLGGDVSAAASTVTLSAAGDIGQTAGTITAGALSASAATGISLADANAAGTVTLANATSGDVDYVSGQTTTVVSVSDPAGNISLATLQSPGGPAVDLTADQVVAGGSIDADVQGTLTIGSATSPVSITTQSDNLVITGQLAAPVVTIESLPGAITVGGAATATGFGLSEASFANIDAADALNIYAGSTASAARGNMTVLDLAIDPAKTPNVNLYAAPGAEVLVEGAVTPTASGGALTIGGDAGSGWQPGSILISGSLGAAQWLNETSFANVDAFGAVSLSAGAILMGSPAFIASVEAMTPAQIDALDDFPPAVQASGDEIGHEFVVAGVLDLTASGEVVQQNTSGARGTFAGVFLTNNTASPGVVLNIDPPTLVELFGSVVAKNGQIISGPTAAASPVLRVNVPGLSFDASLNYRFNGCPIGPVSLTCGSEIVDVGDTFDPSQEFQQSSVAAAESAALSDVFANPPLLEVPPLTGGDQSVDVIPAGSGNEEIWRGSKRHSP